MAEGESGELLVTSPYTMKQYYNKPEETRRTFVEINGRDLVPHGRLRQREADGRADLRRALRGHHQAQGLPGLGLGGGGRAPGPPDGDRRLRGGRPGPQGRGAHQGHRRAEGGRPRRGRHRIDAAGAASGWRPTRSRPTSSSGTCCPNPRSGNCFGARSATKSGGRFQKTREPQRQAGSEGQWHRDILKDKRILAVDDEPDVLDTLQEILEDYAGLMLDRATDYETGFHLLRSWTYDAGHPGHHGRAGLRSSQCLRAPGVSDGHAHRPRPFRRGPQEVHRDGRPRLHPEGENVRHRRLPGGCPDPGAPLRI
ncbi:MAG: hypothetical protein MZU95_00195 [Desulfomicrobium escambiense]|nr:hypothetical protein [Desulfomicrobium escambiense]